MGPSPPSLHTSGFAKRDERFSNDNASEEAEIDGGDGCVSETLLLKIRVMMTVCDS